jgi:hypothetical protein
MCIPGGICIPGRGGAIGGGGGGGRSIGASRRQSSFNVKFLYPCAPTKAKAALQALSIAASLVFPRPHPKSTPPTRVENTKGFSGVTPVFNRIYAASNIRCDLVYLTKASIAL